MMYIEFEFLKYELVDLVNYISLIEIFYFLGKFTYFFICLHSKVMLFLFFSVEFILISLQNLNTKQH
jgi:hypothetical protein